MSIGRFVGDIDLFSNPIEEEEAQERYERAIKEAAEKARKAAEEARKRAEEQRKAAEEARRKQEEYRGPDGKNVPKPKEFKPPEQPKPPEVPKPPEQPKPPEEVNKVKARDGQTLEQQSPATKAAFQAKHGVRAPEEWVREHEKELDRNIGTYGVEEPKAGTKALQGINAPDAPDRTIGRYQMDPAAPAGEAQRPPGSLPSPTAGIPGSPTVSPTNPMVTATTPTPVPGQRDPNSIAPSSFTSTPARMGETLPQVAERVTGTFNEQVNRLTAPPATPTAPATPEAVKPPPDAPPMPPTGDNILLGAPGERPFWVTREQYEQAKAASGAQNLHPILFDPKQAAPATPGTSPAVPTPPTAAPPVPPTPAVPTSSAPAGGGTAATQSTLGNTESTAPVTPSKPMPQDGQDYVYVRSYNGVEDWFRRDEVGTQHTILLDPKKQSSTQPTTSPYQSRNPNPSNLVASADPSLLAQSLPPTPGFRQTSLEQPGMPADPYRSAAQEDRPLDAIVRLTGKNPDEARHIAGGISALLSGNPEGAWAEPYLNDVARLAWSREELQNGRESDPREAPLDYIENWKDAYFGSDTNVPLVKEVDQQMIDYGVQRAAATGKPFDWRDAFGATGEGGLVSKQTTQIDCGPNAASTVLRSMGYNADPGQMFQYAKEKGYHNGSEFTGPDNYARMLRQEGGIPARALHFNPGDPASANAVWARVDAELDAGRVVTLSSPGHYWAVTAKREGPRGTEYYSGPTGTFVGNPAWGTRGQFAYKGAPNVAIVTEGTVDPNAPVVQRLGLKPPTTGTGPNPNNRMLLSAMTNNQQRMKGSQVVAQSARQDPAYQGQPPAIAPQAQTLTTTPSVPPQQARSLAAGPNSQQAARMSSASPYETEQPPGDAPWAPGATPTPAPEAQTLAAPPSVDPRIQAAAKENLWSPNQSNRHQLMQEYQARPKAEREAEFDNAIEQALNEEGITNPGDRQRWRAGIRGVVLGEGVNRANVAENPDLNPYMISGEFAGRPGTAARSNSSALGYFQFLRQHPDGRLYSHDQYLPDEYKDNPFHPTGQVRQFIRAINQGRYKGDPMGPVREKSTKGTWGP